MNALPSTETIWQHLSGDLRRFIRSRVADEHVADDLVQETFVRVHRNLTELEQADRVTAWVYRIARNVVHDHYRKKRLTPSALSAIDLVECDAAGGAKSIASGCGCGEGQECGGALWLTEMVRTLPEGYRQAVELSELEQLPQQDVADRLGLSLSGAKSRIQRGRAMLRDAMNACCAWELDRRGNVMDCEPRATSGCDCCDG